MNINTKKLVMISLFIAINIVFTRLLSFETHTLRIGFTFIPIALCSMLYGPVWGGAAAAIADLVGILLFPKGPFFPGFTLTAFLTGVTYGMFLYNKPKTAWRVGAAVLIVCVVLNLGLDTLWIKILYGQGFLALLPERLLNKMIMIPIQIPLIMLIWKYLKPYLDPLMAK